MGGSNPLETPSIQFSEEALKDDRSEVFRDDILVKKEYDD